MAALRDAMPRDGCTTGFDSGVMGFNWRVLERAARALLQADVPGMVARLQEDARKWERGFHETDELALDLIKQRDKAEADAAKSRALVERIRACLHYTGYICPTKVVGNITAHQNDAVGAWCMDHDARRAARTGAGS